MRGWIGELPNISRYSIVGGGHGVAVAGKWSKMASRHFGSGDGFGFRVDCRHVRRFVDRSRLTV